MIPTQRSFNAWLKKQKPDRSFFYISNCGCVIATWLKETKVSDNVRAYTTDVMIDNESYPFPEWLQDLDRTMVRLDGEFIIKDLREALQS